LVDVSSPYVDERPIAVLILKYFGCRILQEVSHDSRDRSVSELSTLDYLPLSRESEFNYVAFHSNVFWPESRQSIAAVLIGIDLTAGAQKTR
jgi:hypothetical protein